MTHTADATTAALIRENWLRVCQQVADACNQAGRAASEVRIVGVAKYVDAALTAQLFAAGCSMIGENRPQQLWDKHAWFQQQNLPTPQWHLIGHLQRNKVRRTLPLLDMIESVDSLRLAEEINQEAQRIGKRMPILVDVNVTQDSSKTGLTVDQLLQQASRLAELPNIRWCGLMAMSSLEADSATIAKEFSLVRQLRDRLQTELGNQVQLTELSMGMSGDYQQAIAEGATSVRIGSNLWVGLHVADS
jgi:PLP dependent protein